MYTIYGIPNCDTVKKAFTWLRSRGIDYQFHDYKRSGIKQAVLKQWSAQVGWEKLLNKKSTTWRELGPEIQAAIIGEKQAIQLMSGHTSLIKRPVIEKDGKLVAIGFEEAAYQKIFAKSGA